jgi:putative polyketide hydroxylase
MSYSGSGISMALCSESSMPARPPSLIIASCPAFRARERRTARSCCGKKCSTLDLFHREFVLLTGADAHWREATEKIGARRVGIKCVQFGGGDLAAGDFWPESFGVGADGAILVRPDGFVAWRSPALPADAEAALGAVMKRLGLRMT